MFDAGIKHSDPALRLATVRVFGRMGRAAKPVVPKLFLRAMGQSESHPIVRAELRAVFENLSGIRTPPARPARRTGYSEVRRRPAIAAHSARRP